MMCKRLSGLLAGLLLFTWLACIAAASEAEAPAETTPFVPDGSGTILLVHRNSPDRETIDAIDQIAGICASMQKVLDYGPMDLCESVLSKYDHVIAFDLPTRNDSFNRALAEADTKLMIVGSEMMAQYLRLKGEPISGEPVTQTKGQLTYTFPSQETFEGLIGWKDLLRFPADGYRSGSIQAGSETLPFCQQVADVRFLPVQDLQHPLVLTAFVQELVEWMWIYDDLPTGYAQFLVLDQLYPFMPAEQVMERLEAAFSADVPFALSVMPLAANTDYPAMAQFCQLLAYAQSKGASILLHAPIIHTPDPDPEELGKLLSDMTDAYISRGVYPSGIQVPRSWINQEPYLSVLSRYSTIFVYDDGRDAGFDLAAHTSRIARQGHQIVYPLRELDQEGVSRLDCYASATYTDFYSQMDYFLRYARLSKTASNPFSDLSGYTHQVWTESCGVRLRDRMVFVDDRLQDTTFVPTEYDTQYDYHRSALTKISVDLAQQNRVLMVVVLILGIIFLSSIAYARNMMRRRFFNISSRKGNKP